VGGPARDPINDSHGKPRNDGEAAGMAMILMRVIATALALLAGVMAAAAQDTSQGADGQARMKAALELFATNSYAKILDGVEVVAGSGVEHAGKALTLLSRRRVYVAGDGSRGAFRDGSTYFDFVTGAALDGKPDGLDGVRVNNRVRNAVMAALGTLRLRAKDPARRVAAAEAVMRARDVSALPAIEKLLESEADAGVRAAFEVTRASLILADGTRPTPDQVAAIAVLEQQGDQEAIAALRTSLSSERPEVREAAAAAVRTIEGRLALIKQVQNVWYGLSLGSVLLLAAIGLAITFGVMGVINMAHGEMVMLGAYTTFVVQEVFRAYAPGAFDLSLLVAVPAAFLVAGAVGVAIERGIIRFLYGRPLETLLATWGVSLILQQAVRTTFGLKLTTLGLQMRAVTQNRRMAASMGIRTGYVDAMTFGLGSGIAGIAGVALSQIDNVSPNLGQNYIIDSFMVVVFGGVGSLWGTLVSAFALGVTNKFLEPWAGAVLAKIAILVLLILFIQKRPRGLFALKGRAIEA
jgi:urea transport system permease protein